MKNFAKKFLKTLLMLTCVVALTACGQEEPLSSNQLAKQENAEFRAQKVVNMITAFVSSEEYVSGMFDEYNNVELADIFSSMYARYTQTSVISCEGKAARNAFSSFETGLEELGNIQDVGQPVTTMDDDTITVVIPITGANASGSVELIFTNDIYLVMTSCTLNLDQTMGDLMSKAALNTLLGMGTVFVVLILISLIISLFAFIPKIQASFTKKEEPAKTAAPAAPTPVAVAEPENDELADDTELVAVIAAAIAAYEGTSADGFRVRSIRRANTGKWKKA